MRWLMSLFFNADYSPKRCTLCWSKNFKPKYQNLKPCLGQPSDFVEHVCCRCGKQCGTFDSFDSTWDDFDYEHFSFKIKMFTVIVSFLTAAWFSIFKLPVFMWGLM